jgi:multiple sugar transport system permease protein
MQRGTREYALWSIAIALVLIFALVPVVWIMALSLKTPASVADGRFRPRPLDAGQLQGAV